MLQCKVTWILKINGFVIEILQKVQVPLFMQIPGLYLSVELCLVYIFKSDSPSPERLCSFNYLKERKKQLTTRTKWPLTSAVCTAALTVHFPSVETRLLASSCKEAHWAETFLPKLLEQQQRNMYISEPLTLFIFYDEFIDHDRNRKLIVKQVISQQNVCSFIFHEAC